MDRVEVVVAHDERATLRVGDLYIKVDADQERADRETEAMGAVPLPTAEVLWRRPPVLALRAVPGQPLARLGAPSTASPASWAAAGAAVRALHDAPLPAWRSPQFERVEQRLAEECERLARGGLLPIDLIDRNRGIAEAVLRPWSPAFVHGDLQPAHVLVERDRVTGVLDWSEAGAGDALQDLAVLTMGHAEHLADVVAGYSAPVDLALVRAWWSMRSLLAYRWLVEHGFDPTAPGCELDVLRAAK